MNPNTTPEMKSALSKAKDLAAQKHEYADWYQIECTELERWQKDEIMANLIDDVAYFYHAQFSNKANGVEEAAAIEVEKMPTIHKLVPEKSFIYGAVFGAQWQASKQQAAPCQKDPAWIGGYEAGKMDTELKQAAQPQDNGGWVKCSDKLPENRTWCLVFAYSELFLANYKHGIFETEEPRILQYVTHWQPLPNPPKQ